MRPAAKAQAGGVATGRANSIACQACGASILRGAGGAEICEHCAFDFALEESSLLNFSETAADLDEEIPSIGTVGSYELLSEIGRGGMGVIYKARTVGSREIVAVKTLLSVHQSSAEALARFEGETRAVALLKHPHIMPIREVHLRDDPPHFSMCYAGGGTLADLLPKYRHRWRQAAELMVKIARAVQHAHDHGILHRDLKPGNILFTEAYEPLVSDFGLAKWLDGSAGDLTQSLVMFGTPQYVAPEQAQGRSDGLTASADVYSLGAIFFELLTGRPPIVGDHPLAILQQVISERPAPRARKVLAAVPPDLEAVCARSLAKVPDRRYQTAEAFAEDLERWLTGKKVSAKGNLPCWPLASSTHIIKAAVVITGVIGLAGTIKWGFATTRPKVPALVVAQNRQVTPAGSLVIAINDLSEEADGRVVGIQLASVFRELFGAELFGSSLLPGLSQNSIDDQIPINLVAAGSPIHADYVFGVSLRKNSATTRAVIRMVRRSNNKTIWGKLYEVPSDLQENELRRYLITVGEEVRSQLERARTSKTEAKRPDAATSYFKRGAELFARRNQNDNDQAIILYQKALVVDPDFAEAHAALATAYNSNHYFGDRAPKWTELAKASAERALQLDHFCAMAHHALAGCHFSANRFADAREEYLQALEIEPWSAAANGYVGVCWRESGNPTKALPWMLRASLLSPEHGLYSGLLGETYMLLGRDAEAEQALRIYADLHPDSCDTRTSLVILRLWQGRLDEARRMTSELLAQHPDSPFVEELAAEAAFFAGDDDETLRRYQELASKEVYRKNWGFFGAVNPLSAMASVLLSRGRSAEARALLRTATQLDEELLQTNPDNPRLLHDLAASWALAEDTAKAYSYLETAIKAGWVEHRSTMVDPRFSKLRSDARFHALMDHPAQVVPSKQ